MKSIKWVWCVDVSMAQQTDATDDAQTATVHEEKFNGTATLDVQVPEGTDERTVKRVAREYFRDTHGTKPTQVMAEQSQSTDELFGSEPTTTWAVMAADHSCGSNVDSDEYDI
jgi:hypothetical protein